MLDSGSNRGFSPYTPAKIFPLSPIKSVPLESSSAASISAGLGGFWPESYHISAQGGSFPRAGKEYRRTDISGGISGTSSDEETISTVSGAPRFNAHCGQSMMWHAMSPSAPQPKSHQPRQACG